MTKDPYGYAASAAPTGNASQALWSGVGSLVAAMVAPCLCYLPFLLAIPLGGWAMWSGWGARQSADPNERSLAWAGMITGGLGLGWSLMIFVAVGLYLLFVIGLGAMGALADA